MDEVNEPNAEETAAPKPRGRRPRAERSQDAGADSVAATPDDDGPGTYECIHKCMGAREYQVGDQAYFRRHPGRKYFVKTKE